MISIVLPTFNGEKYIRKSIESVINQTYKEWELIIVNDSSTDNTLSIVKEYEKNDSRIKVISNKKNKKIPTSLNYGFSIARGDYYTWTSDDNYYNNIALEKMVNILENNVGVDIVYADYYNIDENGRIKNIKILDKPDNIFYNNCIGACFMYKKAVHKKLSGYDKSKFLVEDYDFWLRAKQFGFKYYKINETLYYYRMHNKSLTDTRKIEIDEATIRLLKNNINWINKNTYKQKSAIWKEISNKSTLSSYKRKFAEYMSLIYEKMSN